MELNSLSLKNFRLFVNETFEFKPLTILIGENSSGKSTIAKALNLLQENLIPKNCLGNLVFSEELHGLGSFESVISKNKKGEYIEFQLKYNNALFRKQEGKKRNHILEDIDYITFCYIYEKDKNSPQNGKLIRFQIAVERQEQSDILLNIRNNGFGDFIFDCNLEWLSNEALAKNLLKYSPKIYTIWDLIDDQTLGEEKKRRETNLQIEKEQNLNNLIDFIPEKEEYIKYKKDLHIIEEKLSNIIDLNENNFQQQFPNIKKLQVLEKKKKEIEDYQDSQRKHYKSTTKEEEKLVAKMLLQDANEHWHKVQDEIEIIESQVDKKILEEYELWKTNNDSESEKLILKLQLEEKSLSSLIFFLENKAEQKIESIYEKAKQKIKEGEIRTELYNQITIGCKKFIAEVSKKEYDRIVKNRANEITISQYLLSKNWENIIYAIIQEDSENLKISEVIHWTEDIDFIHDKGIVQDLYFHQIIGEGENNQLATFLIDQISEIIELAFQPIPFRFLSAKRGFQQRIYQSGIYDSHLNIALAKMLKFQYNNDQEKLDFIQKWATKLGICHPEFEETLQIEIIEGNFVQGHVVGKNGKTNISDKGLGLVQLVPTIIEVADAIKSNELVVIEEPGTYLHPNLQSILVDFFIDAIKLNVHFLIETHSEYFVRKLQWIIAEKNNQISSLDVLIYNSLKGRHREIFIDVDGNLSDKFENGFFDESTKLIYKKEWANISAPENIEALIQKGNKVIFCEGKNVKHFNTLGFKDIVFVPAHNKDDIYIKLEKHIDCLGIMDRDYISAYEFDKIKKEQPRLFSLDMYCFENYLYHPQNIHSLGLTDFDINKYKNEIIEENKKTWEDSVLELQKIRQGYHILKPTTMDCINDNDIKKGAKTILTSLKSDDFDTFYPYFDMKKKCSNLRNCLNNKISKDIKLKEKLEFRNPEEVLVQTPWFKQQIAQILEINLDDENK